MAVADDDLVSAVADRPCGYARYATQLTAAINLDNTVTDGKRLSQTKGKPNRILMQCEGQTVRWTDDPDVDPTTTVGMLMTIGTLYEYSGDLSKLRFIQTAATAILHILYYN
jgi:hypothetical protein